MRHTKDAPAARKKGINQQDLQDLTEEFLDLLVELTSKAKHPTPAGVRLDRMIQTAIHSETSRRAKKKSRASEVNTGTAKSAQSNANKRKN